MAREQVLHMNGGVGETSYANNSLQQRKVISEVRPILEERVTKLYSTIFPDCLKVGDLGCSSGPNALLVASEIVDIIHTKACRLNLEPPTFQIFLNDLPGNDFNTVFKLLPDFYTRLEEEKGSEFGTCSIAGLPGSFYGRLFPPNSMHFFHSSYSIHWLSQPPKGLAGGEVVPLNKENIYFTKRSQPEVYNAYFEQFQQDFELFLRLRSKELVPFGGMVLTFLGRIENNEFVTPWELIGEALNDMVSKGFIDEGKLETFNMPYYGATIKEVKKVIEAEGSFTLQKLESFKLDWDACIKETDKSSLDKQGRAAIISTVIRAVSEPILASHFGEQVLDDLFIRFKKKILDRMMKTMKLEYINLVVSLTKNG